MIESDVLLSNSVLAGGPTASELALNVCKCVQGFGCKWCRHVVNHKYALHFGIMVRTGACLRAHACRFRTMMLPSKRLRCGTDR